MKKLMALLVVLLLGLTACRPSVQQATEKPVTPDSLLVRRSVELAGRISELEQQETFMQSMVRDENIIAAARDIGRAVAGTPDQAYLLRLSADSVYSISVSLGLFRQSVLETWPEELWPELDRRVLISLPQQLNASLSTYYSAAASMLSTGDAWPAIEGMDESVMVWLDYGEFLVSVLFYVWESGAVTVTATPMACPEDLKAYIEDIRYDWDLDISRLDRRDIREIVEA